jgi:predicted nucleotidyltransferase
MVHKLPDRTTIDPRARFDFDSERIQRFAAQFGVEELSLFGSAVREDFSPESDIDVLVSFLPGAHVTLFDLVDMADQLSQILGRPVDLVTKQGLKPLIRRSVIDSSRLIYAAA